MINQIQQLQYLVHILNNINSPKFGKEQNDSQCPLPCIDTVYIHGRMLLTTHLTLQHRHADLESGESLPLASIFTLPWWQSDRSCCIIR